MPVIGQLTLKQLRVFVEVYRERKLSAAAEKLSVTQSAVSILLQQVEETLNTRLFDRSTRALVPTLAADEAFPTAVRIMEDLHDLESRFRARAEMRFGRVRMAVTPAVGMALMPDTIMSYRRKYPDIQLIVEDCAPNQFLPLIIAGSVEFGIGTPEEDATDEIESRLVLKDTLCLVCPVDHPFAGRASVHWRELDGLPFVLGRRGYGVRRMIDRLCSQHGVSVQVVNEVGFLTSILWMVSSGFGLSIMPSRLVQLNQPGVVALVPLEPVAHRTISAVTKRGRSLTVAGEAFVDELTRVLADAS